MKIREIFASTFFEGAGPAELVAFFFIAALALAQWGICAFPMALTTRRNL